MIIVTTNDLPGQEIDQVFGMVKGSTIQSTNIGRDIMAGLKTLVGGEISEYADMLEEARNVALDRMVSEAEKLGADAILGMNFATSGIMQGAAELLVYGTAVKIK